MAITRRFIFDKVNFFLKQENKFFTSAEVLSMIDNEAFNFVARDINYPKTNYSAYLASGKYLVSTPTDFIKVSPNDKIVYRDASSTHELDPKEKTDIGVTEIYTATPSIPEYYYPENESHIGIYPPCTSGIVIIPYVKKPTILTNDSSVNEITEQCYLAAVYWTTKECMLKDKDLERYIVFEKLYNYEVENLKAHYNITFGTPKDIRPHKDWIR